MDWKDVSSAVGKAAPILGTLIGGPAGAAVGSLIASALGVQSTPEAVSQAIAGNPEATVRLAEIEAKRQTDLQSLLLQHESARISAEVEDRVSARDREIKTGDTWTPRILAALFVLGWFVVQWYLIQHIIDPGMRELIMRTLGVMDTALGMILSYYFGSSAGSDRKTEIMAKNKGAQSVS